MAEVIFNNYQTTVAAGGYTSGSGFLNVLSTAGVTIPAGDTMRLAVFTGSPELVVILVATAVNSGTQFAVTAEGADSSASAGDLVLNTLTVGAQSQFRQDWLYGDPVTAPTTSLFGTSVNDANASGIVFASAGGTEAGVVLQANASGVDTAIVARLYPVPSAPYNIRMRFRLIGDSNQFPLNGFCWYDSGTGKLAVFGTMARGGALRLRYTTYTNSHTFNGTSDKEIAAPFGWPGRNGLFDVYCQDNSTNRLCSIIADGTLADRALFQSVSNTDYLTPTHIGIFIGPGDNSGPGLTPQALMTVIDFTQS